MCNYHDLCVVVDEIRLLNQLLKLDHVHLPNPASGGVPEERSNYSFSTLYQFTSSPLSAHNGLTVFNSIIYNIILRHKVTYEIVGVVNFLKLATFSLPIRSIFVKSIPKLFSIKYFITLLL